MNYSEFESDDYNKYDGELMKILSGKEEEKKKDEA
jgi:hypothetical protein